VYDVVTFDCYGTLIDWERGICGAIGKAARAAGVTVREEQIMHAYLEVEPALQAAGYRSYREILREAAYGTARLLGWDIELEGTGFLPASLPEWPPFADTNPALEQLKADGCRIGILSNIDDDLLAATLQHFSVEFDLLVTAEQVRSYKPAAAHFLKARETLGDAAWVHAAQSYFHDVSPACRLGIPVVWVNRNRDAPTGTACPTAEVKNLTGLVAWLRQGHNRV
jgi:2-haloacid dehalogenase/putative hydrolase of the HAD superfamily